MNTIEQLQRRATLAVRTAAAAATARAHIEQALIHARAGRIDLAGIHALDEAAAHLTRAIKRAEQHRLRLLRKADCQESTP